MIVGGAAELPGVADDPRGASVGVAALGGVVGSADGVGSDRGAGGFVELPVSNQVGRVGVAEAAGDDHGSGCE